MNWKTKETRTLIDTVYDPKENEFPGLYALDLGAACWSMDNKRIVWCDVWRHSGKIFCFNIETNKLTALDNQIDDLNSLNMLDFKSDWITASLVGCNRKPSLVVAKLPSAGDESSVNWIHCEKENEKVFTNVDVDLLKFKPDIPDEKYPNLTFECLLVHPKEKNGVLVVFPHGGPHSNFKCELNPHVLIMTLLGYTVLMINYRGSTGYGQNSIDSLPGKIGFNDVKDCQQAAIQTMKTYKLSKATVYGGSHGGFLTLHLIGQYPEFYSAASARNPVAHLETMLGTIDIPDWIITETLGKYEFDFKDIVNTEIYSELREHSPTKYIDQVKTPLLLMIGKVDLRVPCTQSLLYYKGLLARNVPTNLLTFNNDCHPLETPQTTIDCIINTILWYEKWSK